MMQIPADAWPLAVHASDRRVTPETVRVETTEHALMLWIGDTMISVPTDADDTRLQAALHLAWHARSQIERFGALVRAQLDERERGRAAEPALAAMRAAQHPARPVVVPAAQDEPAPAGPQSRPAPGPVQTAPAPAPGATA